MSIDGNEPLDLRSDDTKAQDARVARNVAVERCIQIVETVSTGVANPSPIVIAMKAAIVRRIRNQQPGM
jgi:hypothetical protein